MNDRSRGLVKKDYNYKIGFDAWKNFKKFPKYFQKYFKKIFKFFKKILKFSKNFQKDFFKKLGKCIILAYFFEDFKK